VSISLIEPKTIVIDGLTIYPWQQKYYFTPKSEVKGTEIVPLKASVYGITATGNLTIVFNKPIIVPPIRVDTNVTRLLQDSTDGTFQYDI